ncbi:F-box/FBD/LRR-repeat protein-like protein [Tanacetum coccineum]
MVGPKDRCTDGSTITDLFKCLPVIEHLTLSLLVIQALAQGEIQRKLLVSLVHLKYLYLQAICFINKHELELLVLLIKCSPNLKNLKLTSWCPGHKKFEIDSITLECYSDIRLERLSEFEIGNFGNSKHELEFVKLILARSPVLKKLMILLNNKVSKNEELKMCKILLHSTRASPVVEIMVHRHV